MQFGKSIKADRDALAPLIRLLAQHGDVPHALEHPSVRIDDIYSMGELLGLGQIGKVYRGKHRLTGEKQLRCALSPCADRLSARACVQHRRKRRDKDRGQDQVFCPIERTEACGDERNHRPYQVSRVACSC